ncbi:MAG TPA: hypothetical protein VLW85_14335 [Myxococcales bacterium]|nr:hypothetical protein [Myxococcales bacterium]
MTSVFDAAAGDTRAAGLYRKLAASRYRDLPASEPDAAVLEPYLRARLECEREERRMHFGALALVSVLFFLLLPAVLRDFGNIGLDLIAVLLLALLVPYVFVYFSYENRVRAMSAAWLRLISRRG